MKHTGGLDDLGFHFAVEDFSAGTGEHQGNGVIARGLTGVGGHVGELQRKLALQARKELDGQIPDQVNGGVFFASFGLAVGGVGFE